MLTDIEIAQQAKMLKIGKIAENLGISEDERKEIADVISHPRGLVLMVGPTGSGKSTLTRLLMHEETPTSGSILVDGTRVETLARKEIPYLRRSFGVIFQDFRLLDDRTVFENIAFAMKIVGASKREIRRQVPHLLSMVGLSGKAKLFPPQLSHL